MRRRRAQRLLPLVGMTSFSPGNGLLLAEVEAEVEMSSDSTSDPQRWVDGDLESGADNPDVGEGVGPSGPIAGKPLPSDPADGRPGPAGSEHRSDA